MERWSEEETRYLISIWVEEAVQRKLYESYHNRVVYEEISKKMEGNGYCRSWLQCQRKIKHLKTLFGNSRNSNKSGSDRVTCPYYEELDKVLGDRPSFSPGEGDVLDSALDCSEDPLFLNPTKAGGLDAEVALRNTTPAGTQGNNGDIDDTTGADAASSSSSEPAQRKRPSTFHSGQTRRKKSKFEMILESFSKALCDNKDNEVLLQMQQAQHAHEEKLFGMMLQSFAQRQHVPVCACAHSMPPPVSPTHSVTHPGRPAT